MSKLIKLYDFKKSILNSNNGQLDVNFSFPFFLIETLVFDTYFFISSHLSYLIHIYVLQKEVKSSKFGINRKTKTRHLVKREFVFFHLKIL
jgi:hypothetical protein